MIGTTAPKGIAHSLVRAIEVIDVPRRNPTIVAMPSQMQGGEASPLSTLCRGTGAEAASRAPRARDQGRACARRASSHKSSPRARILSPEYVCVRGSLCTAYKLSPSCVQIVTVVRSGSQCDERREARAHFGTYAHVHMFLALPVSPLCSSLGVIQQVPKILGSKGHHDPRSLSRDTRIILTPRPHGRTLPTATQHITTPETVLRLHVFAAVIAPILPSINGDSGICSNCSSSHQAPPAHGMRAPKVLAVSKPA